MEEAGGIGSMAVGVGAKASLSDTLALGSYALANVAKGQKGYLAGGDTSVTLFHRGTRSPSAAELMETARSLPVSSMGLPQGRQIRTR